MLVAFLLVLVEEGEGEMAELEEGVVEAGVRGLEVSRPAADEEVVVGGGDLAAEEEVCLEGVLVVVAVDFSAD